ncbi:hypothetical protein ALPO108162_09615 [Alicyclobacillus pomorum]
MVGIDDQQRRPHCVGVFALDGQSIEYEYVSYGGKTFLTSNETSGGDILQQQPLWPTYVQAVTALINVIVVVIATVTNFILGGRQWWRTKKRRIKIAKILALRLDLIAQNLEQTRVTGVNAFVEMGLSKGVSDDSILDLFEPDIVSELYVHWEYLTELQRQLIPYKDKADWDIPADMLTNVAHFVQRSLELKKKLTNMK